MDFQELTLDALKDSGALVKCLSETGYGMKQQMSHKDIVKEKGPSLFKLQVPKGNLETSTKTIKLHFEIWDWNFKRNVQSR